jgi:hypothetical protein
MTSKKEIIEICKQRIIELLLSKKNLLQIIADHDEINEDKDNNSDSDSDSDSDIISIDIIEWRIKHIDRIILDLHNYMNTLL